MNIIPIAPNFLLLFVRYCFIMVMKIWQMGGVSMGEVITVLSGKGGTGKTSVCAALATALAEADQRVLCIDCDVGLRNLDISLGLTQHGALNFVDVCQRGYDMDFAADHPDYPTLRFLTAPVNFSAADVELSAFVAMLMAAREEYDYILLDAPAGVETGFRLATRYSDRLLLVTGADPAAMRDAKHTGELLELMGKDQIRLIVNRVNKRFVSAVGLTVDDIMDHTALPLIGVVPEDMKVPLAAADGKPLLLFGRRSSAAAACRRIAKRLMGHHVPISL
jgi:septum site-determining protein MinD